MEVKDTYYEYNRSDSKYLYIDSKENPIDSLETALFFLEKRDDNLKWKWVVLSLHHALYSFSVANLEGSNYREVLTSSYDDDSNIYVKKGNDSWKKSNIVITKSPFYKIIWTDVIEPPTNNKKTKKKNKEKLISFPTAIARVQDGYSWMGRYIISKPLTLDGLELDAIYKLNYWRNDFTHFIPMGLAVSINDIRDICRPVLRIIKFLALKTGQIIYIDNDSEQRIIEVINELEKRFK